MNSRSSLSLEQAPPISVPFRFFLTAPLFALLAACLLMVYGSEVLLSRWSPVTLAFTHLLTLGFLGLIMCGAAMQMSPVLAGSPVPGVKGVSTLIHLALTLGTVALSAGFMLGGSLLFESALLLLGMGFGVFLMTLLLALWRVDFTNPTVIGMRLALISLLVTVVLGIFLGSGFAWWAMLSYPLLLTDIHLVWGLLGWVGLLVIGVAFQVVPMFQMTPEYPGWMTRSLILVLFLGLLVWTLLQFLGLQGGLYRMLPGVWFLFLSSGYVLFGVITLRLQARRKRRLPDVTLLFWRVGMISLLISYLLWVGGWLFPGLAARAEYPLLLVGTVILGFAFSVVNGMLYKIVPFLCWFHLQQRKVTQLGGGGVKVPNMKIFIPDLLSKRQFKLHLLALLLAFTACWWPDWFARPAGLLLGVSVGLLWYNLVQAVRQYQRVSLSLDQAL